ncbi:MAG: WbqC family protein [Chthoniobacter sp.]|nr:WbqC family protein [Chthoniobacter sp.]
MIVAIHQPQYLPWIPYFDKADQCDVFVHLDSVQFQKNGVQNRNQILTAQGPLWLTVPVSASLERTIRDTPIADRRWPKKHIRTIEQEYRRAPHAGLFDESLRALLEQDWPSLAALNIAVTGWMFERLGIRCRCVRASDLVVDGTKDDLVIGICRAVGATEYLSGTGAKSYQTPEKFTEHGIALRYQNYRNQPYSQCHSTSAFTPDLSALDLLLNAGPQARGIMLQGRNVAASA